jgi:hypothetical protein
MSQVLRTSSSWVDTYVPATEALVTIYPASGPLPGPHGPTIEMTGTMNPAATGSWIPVDAFGMTS